MPCSCFISRYALWNAIVSSTKPSMIGYWALNWSCKVASGTVNTAPCIALRSSLFWEPKDLNSATNIGSKACASFDPMRNWSLINVSVCLQASPISFQVWADESMPSAASWLSYIFCHLWGPTGSNKICSIRSKRSRMRSITATWLSHMYWPHSVSLGLIVIASL